MKRKTFLEQGEDYYELLKNTSSPCSWMVFYVTNGVTDGMKR